MNEIDSEKFEALLKRAPHRTQTKLQSLMDRAVAAAAAMSLLGDSRNDAWAEFMAAEQVFLRGSGITRVAGGANAEPVYEKARNFRGDNADWFDRTLPTIIEKWRAYRRKLAAFERARDEWERWHFLSDVKGWLESAGRDNPLAGIALPAVKLSRGQSHADAVDAVRAHLEELADRFAEVSAAPRTADELVAAMSDNVDAHAAQGAVTMYANNRRDSPFNLSGVGIRDVERVPIGISSDTLVWLLQDEIKAKLAARIRAAVPEGMTDAEQKAELARLAAEKLAAERQEEALICAADEAGITIPRRRDADPRAILEIL